MKHLLLCFFCLTFIYSAFSQPIIYVTPSGAGNESGSSWTNAIPGIALPRHAVSASAGTQFWVAEGTYKPTTSTDRTASFSIASGISVYGGFMGTETALDQRTIGHETVLSGNIGAEGNTDDNSQHVVTLYNIGQTIILDSLTIRDGLINLSDPSYAGAGVNIEVTNNDLSIIISNCKFYNNVIRHSLSGGGAIGVTAWANGHCTIKLDHCQFDNNTAGFGGAYTPQTLGGTIVSLIENCGFGGNQGLSESGAISNRYVANADDNSMTIRKCTFVANTALYSGGALTTGPGICTVENSSFSSNASTNTASNDVNAGGAIDGNNSKSLFRNCVFRDNSASYGGAIIGSSSTLQFVNCQFDSNHAKFGGVIYSLSSPFETHLSFLNCNFISNVASTSGGVFCNLLSNQLNAGSYTESSNITSVTNCIIWHNRANAQPVFVPQIVQNIKNERIDNQFLVTYSLIQDHYSGVGNISADPAFLDLSGGNFRLKFNSPAVNAGDPNSSSLPPTDLIGHLRIQGGRVDIGAYEFVNCVGFTCIPFVVDRKK